MDTQADRSTDTQSLLSPLLCPGKGNKDHSVPFSLCYRGKITHKLMAILYTHTHSLPTHPHKHTHTHTHTHTHLHTHPHTPSPSSTYVCRHSVCVSGGLDWPFDSEPRLCVCPCIYSKLGSLESESDGPFLQQADTGKVHQCHR